MDGFFYEIPITQRYSNSIQYQQTVATRNGISYYADTNGHDHNDP